MRNTLIAQGKMKIDSKCLFCCCLWTLYLCQVYDCPLFCLHLYLTLHGLSYQSLLIFPRMSICLTAIYIWVFGNIMDCSSFDPPCSFRLDLILLFCYSKNISIHYFQEVTIKIKKSFLIFQNKY